MKHDNVDDVWNFRKVQLNKFTMDFTNIHLSIWSRIRRWNRMGIVWDDVIDS